MWSYTVGMGRILLRSVKTDSFDTRIDVVFQNVQALKLSTLLPGLEIAMADAADMQKMIVETGLLASENYAFFTVNGSNYSGYVVAGAVASCQDVGEYFEPSELWPTRL